MAKTENLAKQGHDFAGITKFTNYVSNDTMYIDTHAKK